MWTPDIVKARFLEAADTEKLLPRPRVGNGAGFWPKHMYTQDDLDGWDEVARTDNADRWATNRKLTREAISRHDECLDWTIRLLDDERRRHIIWRWAFCQVNGWSFSEACKRRGWVRVTAYKRLEASFAHISDRLSLKGVWVRFPAGDWGLLDAHDDVEEKPTLKRSASETGHPAFIAEKSVNTLKTAEAIEAFASYLDDVSTQRRKDLAKRFARKARKEAEADAA